MSCVSDSSYHFEPMLPFQIRKFRTLSELIVDAQDYIKNPYKGKKLKVIRGFQSWEFVSVCTLLLTSYIGILYVILL